jgi:hypothetical protein
MIKRIKEKKTTTHINYDNSGEAMGKTVVIEDTERTEEIMNDYPDGDVIQCQCDSCDEKHCNNPEDCLCDDCLVDESCSVKCASGAARDGAIPEGVDFIGCKGGCSCTSAEGKDAGNKAYTTEKLDGFDLVSYLKSQVTSAQESTQEFPKPKKVKFITIPDKVTPEELIQLLSTLSGK